jgi:hypothetical protein
MAGATGQQDASVKRAPLSTPGWRRLRLVSLGIAAVTLLTGLWGGLVRLGFALPGGTPALAEFHGALMISGFLGTVIGIERAVAIGLWWSYLAPLCSATGALLLLAGMSHWAAVAFLMAGLALTINSMVVVARQPALFSIVLTVAAACWATGTAAWTLGQFTAQVTGWWMAFLVLTIAAERLEPSRVLSPSRLSQVIFVFAVALVIVGAARGEFAGNSAVFSGLGFVAATLWLLKHDVALRTARQPGQTRFSAICMIAGYVWLGVAGALLLLLPPGAAAFTFDAAVHAIAIGFIFSMIFGHAPIILPAVTGVRIGLSPAAYAPLALLHISVVLRVAADVLGWADLRVGSGPLTLAALGCYAVTLVLSSCHRGRARLAAQRYDMPGQRSRM